MDTSTPLLLRRRLVLATAILLPGLPAHVSAQAKPAAGTRLRTTPAQTEGPYYPVREPKDADFDLLRNGERAYGKGAPAWVDGQVIDPDGKPLKGGLIEIWQCDEAGHYDHPADGARIDPGFQGFGRVVLDADGRFRFRTIKPAPYSGRTPHIHAKVKLGQRELLTTQFYVQGDPGNARDGIWRRLNELDRQLVTQPFVAGPNGLQASYTVVVEA
jgi:protocatechuate 3,4-dioxygenase, beta subunit